LSHSFCKHVVELKEALIVRDAREHPLLKDNPAIKELGAVAYAGLPLVTSRRSHLGTLCFVDTKPRDWNLKSGSIVFRPQKKATDTSESADVVQQPSDRGTASPKPSRKSRRPLLDDHEVLIRSLLEAEPRMTVADLQVALAQRGMNVKASSTIRRWLKRAGLAQHQRA
jgi:hypothetical protein